jgi:signal transduction histidine kinase/ActR/RegA family two-component response regulator
MDTQVKSDPGMDLEFLAGGAAMGERIRAYPWARTLLGEPQFWAQGLRTTVRVLLTTGHPTMIFWGSELTCLYNDAFSRSLGPEKHPAILGAPARRAWAEVWPIVGAQIEQVLRGEGAVWQENQRVPIIRHGELQEVYWTYSYSPIDEPDSPHGVGGVLVTCTETTQQVLAERKLAAERERFVQLFDQAPTFLAVLKGPDHVIELANPGYLKLVGHRAVVGCKVADALPDAVAQGYLALLDEVYRTGKPFSAFGAKYAVQASPDGPIAERHLDFVYQPITDHDGSISGILVQGVDVTARAEADRARALDRARLDYATRLSGVGFWYCDLPFDELQWDERVKDHFFFPPTARITIDDFYARIHEEDRAPTRNAIDASIRDRTPYDIVYRTVHPTTGAIKWIRALGGTDYASDGTPTHFDGVAVDVSAQKLDQQHLATLNHQLREQDQRKNEFLATLAHEMRNPLAPIRNAAELCSRTIPPDSQAYPAIRIVKRQVGQLSRLVDDLLDVSRISQGRIDLKMEIVELKTLIEMARETVAPLMGEKQHELSIIQAHEPVYVKGDSGRLVQAMANVLTNAAKYTDAHGQIRVRSEVRGDIVAIDVTDNGAGISADLLPRVFELFTQSERTLDRAQGGLGIGLSIVKQLIQMHGGECVARSAGVGQGSSFEITLPRSRPITEAALDPRDATRTRRCILVIDDNVDAATSLAEILRLEGHECEALFSAHEALTRAATLRPDFVLLDIGLPGLDGYEVARRLRQIDGLEDVGLIALTGYGQPDDLERGRAAGFDAHFVKPLDFEQLERTLAQGRSRARRLVVGTVARSPSADSNG